MRKIGLDILRGIAVILVLYRHSNLESSNIIKNFGWLGVDLFFVLSGYLISNLLFSEYKKKDTINVPRFLVRRLLKIFPPFYIFLIITVFIYFQLDKLNYNWNTFLAEIFYLQSYFPRIWSHTWSLAVEAHFYISFAIIIFILFNKNLLDRKKLIISSLVFLLILSFILRFIDAYPHRGDNFYSFMQSHLRSDGITIGILISYLSNFTTIKSTLQKFRWWFIFCGFILILPGFYFKGGSFFMNTYGLSSVNIGFGFFLLFTLVGSEYIENYSWYKKVLLLPMAFVGKISYSVYLWHMNAIKFTYFLFSFDLYTMTLIYILMSVLFGFVMWYIVEKPVDYFRNKINFPNKFELKLSAIPVFSRRKHV